jgi:hypothetical protein
MNGYGMGCMPYPKQVNTLEGPWPWLAPCFW